MSSWDGGLLSGTSYVTVISPTLHAPPKRCCGIGSCTTGCWWTAYAFGGAGEASTSGSASATGSASYDSSSVVAAAALFFPFFLANSL